MSGDRGSQITWQLSQSVIDGGKAGLKTWAVKRQTERLFTEYNDRAEWGTLHFSAPAVSETWLWRDIGLWISGYPTRVRNFSITTTTVFKDRHTSE